MRGFDTSIYAYTTKTTLTSNMTESKSSAFNLTYKNFDAERIALQSFESKSIVDENKTKISFLRAPVKYLSPKGVKISCSLNGPLVLMSRGLKREMKNNVEKWKCCIKVDPNDPEFGPEGMKLAKVIEQAGEALKPKIKMSEKALETIGARNLNLQIEGMTGGFIRSGEDKGTATEDSIRYLYCDVIYFMDSDTGKVNRADIKKLKLNPETRKPETKVIKDWSQLIGADETGDPFMDLVGIPTLKISFVTLAAGKVKMNVNLVAFTIVETREAKSLDRHKVEVEELLASDPSFMSKLEAELAKAKDPTSSSMKPEYSVDEEPLSSDLSFGDDTSDLTDLINGKKGLDA